LTDHDPLTPEQGGGPPWARLDGRGGRHVRSSVRPHRPRAARPGAAFPAAASWRGPLGLRLDGLSGAAVSNFDAKPAQLLLGAPLTLSVAAAASDFQFNEPGR